MLFSWRLRKCARTPRPRMCSKQTVQFERSGVPRVQCSGASTATRDNTAPWDQTFPVTWVSLPWLPNDIIRYEVCAAVKNPFLDMLYWHGGRGAPSTPTSTSECNSKNTLPFRTKYFRPHGIFHNLYSSPNINRMIKSRRMRWAGHVARMGDKRNAYRILVGKPEGKRSLGRPKCRWLDNIKMDRKGWYGLYRLI
jgi:hypothetical protein